MTIPENGCRACPRGSRLLAIFAGVLQTEAVPHIPSNGKLGQKPLCHKSDTDIGKLRCHNESALTCRNSHDDAQCQTPELIQFCDIFSRIDCVHHCLYSYHLRSTGQICIMAISDALTKFALLPVQIHCPNLHYCNSRCAGQICTIAIPDPLTKFALLLFPALVAPVFLALIVSTPVCTLAI